MRQFAPAQGDPARLTDGALQTLRQARVQMLRRPRPWTQVLPFGELSGLTAADGLCVAGVSRSVFALEVTAGALESRLASAAGVVRADRDVP
jgi:hypothetical protein